MIRQFGSERGQQRGGRLRDLAIVVDDLGHFATTCLLAYLLTCLNVILNRQYRVCLYQAFFLYSTLL